ncbi:MAG: DUF72 domain-containing protein [Candidatus Marinimicrobia bacterium]|nr:DUF72 domain-containing protein [Candidatus Neomarinimicrobiota bacterium]
MAKIFVGTSGFSYPHWGQGLFFSKNLPQAKWFAYYGQHYNTVELNVSFYRLPKKETFKHWRQQAGKEFIFAVKGSRYITQMKKLKDYQVPVKRFFEAVSPLLTGPTNWQSQPTQVILWQLPPRFKANPERLTDFLKGLPRKRLPRLTEQPRSTWRHAFEFRDESWLTREILEILKKHKAAIVFQDYPQWPMTEEITADFIYLRFHGRTRLYSSCYTEKELRNWAKKIKSWAKRGFDVYAYFNNDALGNAVENAQTLKKLCSKKK